MSGGEIHRVRLLIRGVVQGVGFRPYVYNLARRHFLAGFVMNSSIGVVIEIEGSAAVVEAFLAALPSQGPPLMQIAAIEREAIEPQAGTRGDAEFAIRESDAGPAAFTLVPPDICVCAECLAEVRDPANRRYEYPFTNCTNCGPRYSIIRDVPYDRQATTMAGFAMCTACRKEYEDPADRRFHAQPNACAVCGPRMRLVGRGLACRPDATAREVLEAVAEMLERGGIAAWKGLGGYQLACDARQPEAVEELRRRKRRSEKPFAVMVADLAAAESICCVSRAEQVALESRERPIVLLRRRPGAALAEAVSPGNPLTGVMLPCTPMHDLLFRILRERCAAQRKPEPLLIMTSGNVSEEPIVIDEADAESEDQLGGIADAFVHHDRPIHTRVDDSIVRVVDEAVMVLRKARGYAPGPVWLGPHACEVLACGAQQKSTFCLAKAGFALVSQHLGDLENYETLAFYEETLERMRKLFHVTPTVVAHDLHPGYMSTQLAMRLDTQRRIGVQHHHAHIASCMAEHGLDGRVIGVAWDGTGYGTDGAVWGGEFLAVGLAGFERYAHLRNVLLAGGDRAVREPWRLARSYARDAFDTAIPAGVAFRLSASMAESQPGLLPGPRPLPEIEARIAIVDAMLAGRIHTSETSSCGRLFDAVASLIGLRHAASFEGQAAMALEAAAATAPEVKQRYEFAICGSAPAQVDLRPMVRQIVEEVERGRAKGEIAARFHNTLVAVVGEVCGRMRRDLELSRVCLSGGCFQNALLLRGCVAALRADGFEVFVQERMPANDGGIALGQAAIACEMLRLGV